MLHDEEQSGIERDIYSMNMQKSNAFCHSNAFHSLSYISSRFPG